MRAFLLVLLVAGPVLCQSSTPAYWRFAPPAPALLIGADWKQLTQSKLSGLASGSMAGARANLDFAEEITSALVAAEPAGGGGKPRFLAIAAGKFNEAKLRKAAASERVKPVRFRGVDLFSSGGTDVAVVDGWILLIGDDASVRSAIERGATATPREGAIWRRAAELSVAYSIWIASDSLQSLQGEKPPAASVFSDVQSIAGGIALNRGMEMAFDLTTSSTGSARTLAGAIQTALDSAPVEALRDRTVRPDGATVKVTAALDFAKLQEGVKGLMAGGAPSPHSLSDWITRSRQPAPQIASSRPAPVQRKTIRIVGLDEGTREIPYPAPGQ